MMPVVHIYIDRSEAETWNYDEIDNLQGFKEIFFL